MFCHLVSLRWPSLSLISCFTLPPEIKWIVSEEEEHDLIYQPEHFKQKSGHLDRKLERGSKGIERCW